MKGSNALKQFGITTRRISAEEYYPLRDEILAKLRTRFEVAEDILAYKNKKDFGDLDALVVPKEGDTNYRIILKELFDYTEIYCNNPVFSFDYKNFQIDVVITSADMFESAYTYYSYNDLGNLMGRIAHKFGCKYGHDGFNYVYRSDGDDKVLGTIEISKNIEKIFTFLGFDYDWYKRGFDELQDIFDYVIDSKYFNPKIYAFEALNHQNRTRNRKRVSYKTFVDLLEATTFDKSFFEFDANKKVYLPAINRYFPEAEILKHVEEFLKKDADKKAIQENFNGNIVSEITGLKGADLGSFIVRFKATQSNFEHYALNTTPENVKSDIKIFWDICRTGSNAKKVYSIPI